MRDRETEVEPETETETDRGAMGWMIRVRWDQVLKSVAMSLSITLDRYQSPH